VEVIYLQNPQYNLTLPPIVVALGYFDGVHLGHQNVILEAKRTAEQLGYKSAVMTFDPHPSVVLGKSIQHVEYISPLNDKLKILNEMEIDYVFVVNFTKEFSHLLPQEFIDQYIISLNIKHVVAGFDFTYGKMGKGTMETIPFHSRNQFTYTIIPKLTNEGEKISSTLIRSYISKGKMQELICLLGRYYRTTGEVVDGDKRGRTIGFPTANIQMNSEYLLPPVGVYAVKLQVNNIWHQGVCNIGHKPTFQVKNVNKPTIEVHIFDFEQDIYGMTVTIEWHRFIREEQKFNGIESLVKQLHQDKKVAQQYFQGLQML
jgi:riboflavin kinase / FMN adenylyltransferase